MAAEGVISASPSSKWYTEHSSSAKKRPQSPLEGSVSSLSPPDEDCRRFLDGVALRPSEWQLRGAFRQRSSEWCTESSPPAPGVTTETLEDSVSLIPLPGDGDGVAGPHRDQVSGSRGGGFRQHSSKRCTQTICLAPETTVEVRGELLFVGFSPVGWFALTATHCQFHEKSASPSSNDRVSFLFLGLERALKENLLPLTRGAESRSSS